MDKLSKHGAAFLEAVGFMRKGGNYEKNSSVFMRWCNDVWSDGVWQWQ